MCILKCCFWQKKSIKMSHFPHDTLSAWGQRAALPPRRCAGRLLYQQTEAGGAQLQTSDSSLGVFDKLTLADTECQTQLVKYTKWRAWPSDVALRGEKEETGETGLSKDLNGASALTCAASPSSRQPGAPPSASPPSSPARVRRCSALRVMTRWQDGPFDHWAVALQRGSQNEEDNCKVSAQEICGNKVSTCHSCETLLKAHSSSDKGSLRQTLTFVFCLSSGELRWLHCSAHLDFYHLPFSFFFFFLPVLITF